MLQVDWAEVNAAFGYCATLLAVVAARMGNPVCRFRVDPMGSFSKVKAFDDDRTSHDL